MFARYDMGAAARDELASCPGYGETFEVVARTVPGFKDLAVAAKVLSSARAAGSSWPWGCPARRPSTSSARTRPSTGIMSAQLMTSTPILEVFVHEDETDDPAELARLFENRSRAHARNAYWMLFAPEELRAARGPGRAPGLRRRRTPERGPARVSVGFATPQGGHMPDAVIVATGRTPIGRAFKGSLVDMRPDDLTALVVRTVLEKVPELDPHSVEDLLVGCGQPAGESGFNVARVAAVLAGLDDVPGVTVNRYCSSSLQTIRMAAHAIRAGEGDVFVAAGVETRVALRLRRLRRTARGQPALRRGDGAHGAPRRAGRRRLDPARRACPTSTSRWARPPRTSRSGRRSRAPRWTSSRCAARSSPSRRRPTVSSSARSSR